MSIYGLVFLSHPPFEACTTSESDAYLLALMNYSLNAPHFVYPRFGYSRIGLIDNDIGIPTERNESKAALNLEPNSYPLSSCENDPGGRCNPNSFKN